MKYVKDNSSNKSCVQLGTNLKSDTRFAFWHQKMSYHILHTTINWSLDKLRGERKGNKDPKPLKT